MIEFLFSNGPLIAYALIVGLLVLAGAGLPVPEEVVVVSAGILSSHGHLDPWLAFAVCLAGAIAGDSVMYFIGYHFGRGVVREHPWYAHFLTPQREAQVEHLFHRHGLKLFFVARFLVGLRSPVYLTSGILHVPYRRFLLIDLVSATVVVGTFFSLSFYYGTTITRWIQDLSMGLSIVLLLALLLASGIILWRNRKRALEAARAAEGIAQDAARGTETSVPVLNETVPLPTDLLTSGVSAATVDGLEPNESREEREDCRAVEPPPVDTRVLATKVLGLNGHEEHRTATPVEEQQAAAKTTQA
ncbi:MAG: DedA family protein [Planctomycetota bacterium]